MTLTSLPFAACFLCFFVLLILLPKPARRWALLAGNILFCCSYGPAAFGVILGCALVTWGCGLLIANGFHKKSVVGIGIVLNVLLLAGFKYAVFPKSWIVPVGVSFFTLRCVSYIMDVYRGKFPARRDLFDVLIWVSFFPQIISGPIERPEPFFDRLERFELSAENMRNGALQYFWGIFLKLVLAERLSGIETAVFSDFAVRNGGEILIASVAYTLYIYCDFLSYTEMSRGISRMIGFETARNFRQPYLAVGIKDFWKRWHMSLTGWLTDYVYIPLGGNRKGPVRKCVNIILVFLVSGAWHGPTLNFIFWGLLHAFAQVIEELWQQSGQHLPKTLSRLLTFGYVNFAWIFFNSGGLNRGFRIVSRMFTAFEIPKTVPGTDLGNLIVLLVGLMILLAADILEERTGSVMTKYLALPWGFRILLLVLLLWTIILLGIYGPGYDTSGFIYAQF